MSYSGDPSTSGTDAVRFWAQDTGDPELLSDPEIDYLATYSGLDPDVYPIDIAALAADRIAAKYAGSVTINADGVSYSGGELYQKYQGLAKELRQTARVQAGQGGAPYIGNWATGKQFGIGMHDNPQAIVQSWELTGDDALAQLVDPDTGKVD